MNSRLYLAVSALALALPTAPAVAQHAGHQMATPAPTNKTAPVRKKPAAKKPAVKKSDAERSAARKPVRPAAGKPVSSGSDKTAEGPRADLRAESATPADHSAHRAPSSVPAAPAVPAVDHSQMDHSQMSHSQMVHSGPTAQSGGHDAHPMAGALGPHPMQREASGTAWQPDTSQHFGIMTRRGDWTVMGHGVLNLVHDRQGGRRGDDKTFASGMVMGMAQRALGKGQVHFKAMLSPDPLMGARGYPLLLASGETADGETRLIDRQHPHDFFMELSTSLSQNVGPKSSVFLYAGLPGAPAFGPPAFMHREAIMDSPEAPISHHWLDSTHISFGVLTAGFVLDRFKLEVSRFNGREPDEKRWNIETGPLDSSAVRLSWNPTAELALQGSWGHFEAPEALEPGVDQKRFSASALYAREVGPGLKFAGSLAWGRKIVEHHADDAFTAEASLKKGGWTAFARGEIAENRELLDAVEHGPAYRVGKVSLGAVHDFQLANNLKLGTGALGSVNFLPRDLAPLYGSRNPIGGMAFVRLKVE